MTFYKQAVGPSDLQTFNYWAVKPRQAWWHISSCHTWVQPCTQSTPMHNTQNISHPLGCQAFGEHKVARCTVYNYILKNSLAVKSIKKVWPCLNSQCDKSCENKGVAKKRLWQYRLLATILIKSIRVTSCWLHQESAQNSPELSLKYFFYQPIPLQPLVSLPPSLIWQLFHTGNTFWTGLHLFIQPGCFWVYITSFSKLT